MLLSYDQVKSFYVSKGYKFYDVGGYNVNLFGFRNKDLSIVDSFNDYIGVAYLDQFMNKQCLLFAGTTKPGLTGLKDKLGNAEGTAILIPGQYPKSLVLGKHNRGKEHEHEALVQNGSGVFKTWRDSDLDGKFTTTGAVYTNVAGLNLHTTREHRIVRVGGFSMACQVVQDDKEHSILMNIVKRSAEWYPENKSYTYTLFQLS